MTNPTTTPTPPEGLTDERLLELMPEQFRIDLTIASRLAAQDAGPDIKPGLFRVILNTGAFDYARAAIAADRAARPAPTPEEIEAQFRAWWPSGSRRSPTSGPPDIYAILSHVEFAIYLLKEIK